MKKSLKWSLLILGIIIVIVLSIFVSLAPLEVEVIEVLPKNFEESFEENGVVVAKKEEVIYSKVQGLIEEVYVKEGDLVKEGDILIKVDTKDLEYQLTQLEEQKRSTKAQETKSYKEMEQQIDNLKAQLKSLEGQRQESNKGPYKSQINQQELMIEEAKRQLEIAQKEYDRILALFENGAISKTEEEYAKQSLEQAQNNLKIQEEALSLLDEQKEISAGNALYYEGQKEAIESQIALLESQLNNEKSSTKQYYEGVIEGIDAQIEQVKYKISNGEIKAPFEGIISNLNAKKGMPISSEINLMNVFDPKGYEVETFVLTEDIIGIKEGMDVTLIQERKDKDILLQGVVDRIAPAAEDKISPLGLIEQRVKVIIELKDNEVELRPGYNLDVEFVTYKEENKLVVPKVVLFTYNDGDALWVVRDEKAKIQPVETGLENDSEVVILEGLQEGDKVIKNPQLEGLKEGKKIKIK